MKIYVGIDIAKLNHFAAAISSDGEIIIEPFKFTNDADGFQLLVSKLESFDKNSIIIGLESTAHYGDNLVRFLVTGARFLIHVETVPFGMPYSLLNSVTPLPALQCRSTICCLNSGVYDF